MNKMNKMNKTANATKNNDNVISMINADEALIDKNEESD